MEKNGISVEIIGSETEKKQFGEMVAAVDEATRKKYVSAAVEAARSEVQQKFANTIEFKVDTAKKKVINAQITPLYKLEDMFLRGAVVEEMSSRKRSLLMSPLASASSMSCW